MRGRRIIPCGLSVAGLCAWCAWASGFHHSTEPALAAWSASLAGVVGIDLLLWNGRHNRRPCLRLRPSDDLWPTPCTAGSARVLFGVWPWLVIFLVVLGWEVLGIDTGPHEPHLTISALAQAFRLLNAALLFVWILVGIGYGATRARRPVGSPPSQARHDISRGGFAIALLGRPVLAPALLLPGNRAFGVAFWAGLVVACVLADLAARGSRGRLANAEQFVRLVTGPPIANALFVVAWTYAGWHLFAH
jgi:hypothetical protein